MNGLPNLVGLLLSWLAAGLVTYGYQKARTAEFERRVVLLEVAQATVVNRLEFESRIKNMADQLNRIEDKLDKYFMSSHQDHS